MRLRHQRPGRVARHFREVTGSSPVSPSDVTVADSTTCRYPPSRRPCDATCLSSPISTASVSEWPWVDPRPLSDAGGRSLTAAVLLTASPFLLAAICDNLDGSASAWALNDFYGDPQHADAKTDHVPYFRDGHTVSDLLRFCPSGHGPAHGAGCRHSDADFGHWS